MYYVTLTYLIDKPYSHVAGLPDTVQHVLRFVV